MNTLEVSYLTSAEDIERLIAAYGDILAAYEQLYEGPRNAARASREYCVCRQTRERLIERRRCMV